VAIALSAAMVVSGQVLTFDAESSTSALTLVLLPIYACVAVIVTYTISGGVRALAEGRAALGGGGRRRPRLR